MQEELKSIKQYAKEAKKRLKSGFWQQYHKELNEEIVKAKEVGVSEIKVKEFYTEKVSENIIKNSANEFESFYQKVKKILDEEGEIPNVIGRLTDEDVYNNLSYEEKQRYTLSLSEKYLLALERYNKEKSVSFNVD